jgi:hypothetical protein
MRFLKTSRKLIIAIFIIETLLCSTELVMILKNYVSGTEQWPWFFTFIANFPASVILGSILKIIFEILEIGSFKAQVVLSYIAYLVGGTLWWTFLIQGIVQIGKVLKKIDKGNV